MEKYYTYDVRGYEINNIDNPKDDIVIYRVKKPYSIRENNQDKVNNFKKVKLIPKNIEKKFDYLLE